MNFQTFWNQLSKDSSSGKEFFTPSRKKPFSVTFHNDKIIIKPSKIPVYERPINRKEFLKIWTKASKLSVGQRFVPKNYHDDTFHASYIIPLIKSIVKDNDISV